MSWCLNTKYPVLKMIRTNRALQFVEWSGGGQRQSAVRSQCHGLQKLHASHNLDNFYPYNKVVVLIYKYEQPFSLHYTFLKMFFWRDYKTIWRMAVQLLCYGWARQVRINIKVKVNVNFSLDYETHIKRVKKIFVILQLLPVECLRSYFPFSQLQISTWHQVTRTITLTLRKTNCMEVHSKCNKYISHFYVSSNSAWVR